MAFLLLNPVQCSICNSPFPDEKHVKAHQKAEHPHMCYICNQDFESEEADLKHIQDQHARYLDYTDILEGDDTKKC